MRLILGVVLGIASSFVAWFVTARLLRPKLVISPYVSRVDSPDADRRYVYRIKVKNLRRREAIDLELGADFLTKGVHPNRPGNTNRYEIPIDPPHLRRLKPRGVNVVWIDLHRAEGLARRLPQLLANRLNDGTLRLEDLLR